MTPKEFVRIFNNKNPQEQAKLFVDNDLKEAQVNMLLPVLDPRAPVTAIVIAGYTKVEAAVYYAIMRSDERRVPMGAFRMYADGERTFQEWAALFPNRAFPEGLKKIFIETFEGAGMPEYLKQ